MYNNNNEYICILNPMELALFDIENEVLFCLADTEFSFFSSF